MGTDYPMKHIRTFTTELPYIPHLSEEFALMDEINEEMEHNTERGRELMWFKNRINKKLKEMKNERQ